jgi:hypothetical protein
MRYAAACYIATLGSSQSTSALLLTVSAVEQCSAVYSELYIPLCQVAVVYQ